MEQQDSQSKLHGEYRKKPTGRIIETASKLLTSAEFVINRLESKMQLQLGEDEVVAVVPVNENKGRRVTITNIAAGTKVGIQIPDVSLLTAGNKATLTLLHFSLAKVAEEALGEDGKLKQPYIRFKIKEYQQLGGYTTAKAARRSIMQGARILQAMQVEGTLGYINQWTLTSIFRTFTLGGEEQIDSTGRRTKKRGDGWCTVVLETGETGVSGAPKIEINWKAIIQSFSILPNYYYYISARPGALLDWITYIARLRIYELGQNGYFTLRLDTIQRRLGLPEADATDQPGRDIKGAIYTAVKGLQETHQEYFNNKDLELEIINVEGVDDTDVEVFLSKGRLKVTIRGEMLKQLQAAAGRKQLTPALQADSSKIPAGEVEV